MRKADYRRAKRTLSRAARYGVYEKAGHPLSPFIEYVQEAKYSIRRMKTGRKISRR